MKPYAIGMDVGGSKIKAGLVRQDGSIVCREITNAHAEHGPAVVINAIEGVYRALLDAGNVQPHKIEAVGLGFAGTVNGPAGLVLVSSNLPNWNHYPLRDEVAQRLGVKVLLENDSNICGVGEHRFGAGKGVSNMCYATFSTGFGLALIIHDELYVGNGGTAAELSHMVVKPGGPVCTCGKHGCLMSYASGVGISRMVYEQVGAGVDTVLRDLLPADGRRIGGDVVAKAAHDGDVVAKEILHTAGYYGGIALSWVVQMINPELIVLGGGLTRIGNLLLDPLRAGLYEHTQPELHDSFTLVPWTLGDDIGIVGAAAQVFKVAETSERP
jgi:glucokinase